MDSVNRLGVLLLVTALAALAWAGRDRSQPARLPNRWGRRGVVLIELELGFSTSFWGWPPSGKRELEVLTTKVNLQTWAAYVREGELVPAAALAVADVALGGLGLREDGTLVRLEGHTMKVVETAPAFADLSVPPKTFRLSA